MDIKLSNTKKCLFVAVKYGIRSEIQHIIKNGVNINAQDTDGWTPLMIATDKEDIETVKLLIELGADVNMLNSDSETALMLSAYCNNEKIGKLLIEKGACVTFKDKIGRTAYDIATELFPDKNHEYLKEQERTIISEKSDKKVIKKRVQLLKKNFPENKIQKDENIIQKSNNTIVLEEDYKRFFNLFFFIKKGGTKVDYYYIEKSFKNHFHKDFNVMYIYKYINYFNNLHKTDGGGDGKSIMELDTGDFLVLPSMKEKEIFFKSCLCINDNIGIKNLESIKISYREKFYIELEMKDLWSFISGNNDTKSKIQELENGYFEIKQDYVKPIGKNTSEQKSFNNFTNSYPSKDKIILFLNKYFRELKIDSFISYGILNEAFKKKFSVDLNPDDISYFMKYFNYHYKNLEITRITSEEYKLGYPTEKINQFLYSLFKNTQAGIRISLQKIQKEIQEKYDVDLNEKYIAGLLSNYNDIESSRNEQKELCFFRIPAKDEIYYFFDKYINVGDKTQLFIFSFEEINDSFYNEYKSYLIVNDLIEWINIINESYPEYIIESLPNEIFVRRPLQKNNKSVANIFSENWPFTIDAESSLMISEYKSKINKYLSKHGLIIRPKRTNKNEYILTSINDFITDNHYLIISDYLRRFFLEEKVGFKLSCKDLEERYDIVFEDCFYENIISNANIEFKDIKLLYDRDKKIIFSEFKLKTKEPFGVEEKPDIIECPVCGVLIGYEQFKNHYLHYHVSKSLNCSILVCMSSELFYCNHCKHHDLQLRKEGVPSSVIIQHLSGACKNRDFYNKKNCTNKNNINVISERIWHGFAYSNNVSFLGNSGQIYRDNGAFGSYPVEDNYT